MRTDEFIEGEFVCGYRPDGSVRILSYRGLSSELMVPSMVRDASVTALASNAFKGNSTLERVVLPDSVEFTGHRVFERCGNLVHVTIPASLGRLSPSLFRGCHRLASIELRSPMVKLENESFSDCPVEEILFGPGVVSLAEGPLPLPHLARIFVSPDNPIFTTDGFSLLFDDGACLYRLCVPGVNYRVPESVRSIADRAFDSLAMLRDVELPDGLSIIGRLAFAKTGVSHLTLPSSLEHICEKAFYHCARLSRVEFPRGLRSIGAEAFAGSGLEHAHLPASLDALGPHAFDRTPAQRGFGGGTLSIAQDNPHMQLAVDGALYSFDTLIELIARVPVFETRKGTRYIGRQAFKRNDAIRQVVLPEGVVDIGEEAFRSCRKLAHVDLPDSVERIGPRAFFDTALSALRLSAKVREIGENALLVRGDAPHASRAPLSAIELDPENPWFYLENGLLIARGGNNADGGDACLVYVGPDAVVTIPDAVTRVSRLAFSGASGIAELRVHDHLQSVCEGAFSTAQTIPVVRVRFPRPVDGYDEGTFFVPHLSARYQSPTALITTDGNGTVFDFDYYDSWVTHASTPEEFARAGVERLSHPMRLTPYLREVYEGVFRRRCPVICRYFASRGDLASLELLMEWDLLPEEEVSSALEETMRAGHAHATACLLELRHRMNPDPIGAGAVGIDFSL